MLLDLYEMIRPTGGRRHRPRRFQNRRRRPRRIDPFDLVEFSGRPTHAQVSHMGQVRVAASGRITSVRTGGEADSFAVTSGRSPQAEDALIELLIVTGDL